MLPEAYRDATLTVERPSFGNGTQAAEAGNSVSPGSLQQLTLPDAIPETEDGMIGFSQKVDDRTAYTLLYEKCGTTLYYTAVQAENVEKASQLAKLELCAAEDMGAEKLLQQHKRWWQQYWGKSSLQLPDETLEQLWYRANYFWQRVPSRAMPRCRCKGYGARMTTGSHRGKAITTTTSTPNSPIVTI